jgi:hypothetical protein
MAMTTEGDLVLVHIENQPAFFARIESIFADVKPHWFQVKMLVLQVPLVVITWILREPYINGEEFTMGGRPIRMEKVIAPEATDEESGSAVDTQTQEEAVSGPESGEAGDDADTGKVISLKDRRKKPKPQ